MERSVKELSKYRFECSIEALEDANILFERGRYKNTLNRAYYAIFNAIRSVNALDGFDSSKHSGVISYFNKNYIKEGVFPKEASKIIKLAQEKRETADYLDFFIASEKDAEEQISRAKKFVKLIEEYLIKKEVLKD